MIHSKLGASSMYRWQACPGSVKKCEGLPEIKSTYAQEGTDAHKLAEMALIQKKACSHWIGKKIGETLITEDISRDVAIYVAAVLNDWPLKKRDKINLQIEHRFNLDWFMPGKQLFGTNDANIAESFGLLIVHDLKFGKGVLVEVKNNSQGLYYALGALGQRDFAEIEIAITQPRISHPDGLTRRWRITQEQLLEWGESVLKSAVIATENPNAPLIAGHHCQFCPAKQNAVCEVFKEWSMVSVKAEFSAFDNQIPSINHLTNEQLADVIEKLDLAISFQKDCQNLALQRALSGEKIPGFKLVQKKSHRKWSDENQVAERFRKFGVKKSKIYKESIDSPTQIRKLFYQLWPKGDFEKFVGDLIVKPDLGLDLVRLSDNRKAVDPPISDDFDLLLS